MYFEGSLCVCNMETAILLIAFKCQKIQKMPLVGSKEDLPAKLVG